MKISARNKLKGTVRGVTRGEAIAKIRESGHSRLPVYRERIDNVVGVLAGS